MNEENQTKQRIESLDASFYTSSVNAFEIWMGRKESERVLELLSWLEVIPFDMSAACLAGDVMRSLKKDGNIIEFRDLFVATICIRHNIELLTYNQKHFARLKKYGLKLVA
ncbi:MAG TPA: type II toxin-antitoxin system VapC family toxin [Candidatus Nanoarchaeia archaeon]|nr:type II toxin-antitoxin system VapC family toxin [Candidatus Nanoarchaeia archaeon]